MSATRAELLNAWRAGFDAGRASALTEAAREWRAERRAAMLALLDELIGVIALAVTGSHEEARQ